MPTYSESYLAHYCDSDHPDRPGIEKLRDWTDAVQQAFVENDQEALNTLLREDHVREVLDLPRWSLEMADHERTAYSAVQSILDLVRREIQVHATKLTGAWPAIDDVVTVAWKLGAAARIPANPRYQPLPPQEAADDAAEYAASAWRACARRYQQMFADASVGESINRVQSGGIRPE